MVIVELPVAPVLKSAGDEAVIAKSVPTVKVNTAGAECDAVPGEQAPAIVTGNMPAEVELQDNDDVPVPFEVSDTGVTVNALQVKPVVKEAASLGVMAEMVKSPTWTVEVAE